VCQDGQTQPDKSVDNVDTSEPLNWAFQDAMAPRETRWTVGLGFTHQRSGVRSPPRPLLESVRGWLVSRRHLLPERPDYPLDFKGFLLEVSYHSPLTVSGREVTDVLIHHQLRAVVSQLISDLGALLAKQNQEVLGLLNVGVDPTLRG
jgi:hypothetical protein